MKKFVAAFLIVMGLALDAPAHATPTWEPTKCWAQPPWNSQVQTAILGTLGPVFTYRSAVDPDPGKSLYGNALWYYKTAGAECGRFGLLYNSGGKGSTQTGRIDYYWWYFETPGNCDLRYIITVANNNQPTGTTYEGLMSRAFC